MSSFVIRKDIYMRAAGLVAGLQDVKRRHFVFDHAAYKWMEPDDFQPKFSHFYDLNALSVAEQYGDRDMEGTPPTERECAAVFRQYRQKGRQAAINGKAKDIVMLLRNFTQCALYQTEKEGYYYEMQMFFNRLLVALLPILHPEQCDGWTDFDEI